MYCAVVILAQAHPPSLPASSSHPVLVYPLLLIVDLNSVLTMFFMIHHAHFYLIFMTSLCKFDQLGSCFSRIGCTTTHCDQLVARHAVADNSLRYNFLQRLLVAATPRCAISRCETTRCMRQLVAATTGCDDQSLQLSVPLSFRTILTQSTLANHDAIVAFNRQCFNYQFLIFEMLKTLM